LRHQGIVGIVPLQRAAWGSHQWRKVGQWWPPPCFAPGARR
jgi:hypothetical protein